MSKIVHDHRADHAIKKKKSLATRQLNMPSEQTKNQTETKQKSSTGTEKQRKVTQIGKKDRKKMKQDTSRCTYISMLYAIYSSRHSNTEIVEYLR